MKRFGRLSLFVLVTFISAIVLWWNFAIHTTPMPGSAQERQQVLALLEVLKSGMHNDVPARMQRLFPEGEAFTYALYGLANCNVSARGTVDERAAALYEAEWSLAQLESDRVKGRFPALLPPGHGIFHAGWSALLQGHIIAAKGVGNVDPAVLFAYTERCDTLMATFSGASASFPPSYNDMAWPADGVVALAAVALHDRLLPAKHQDALAAWVERVSASRPANEGIAHAWDPRTNTAQRSMRGSSMALMCTLLPAVDSTLATEQFAVFRSRFFAERLGVPVITECPSGHEGQGDVDSGPLIFGAGPVAMIMGAGACRVHGDVFHALEMNSTVDGFGLVLGGHQRQYLFGAMPIADLFIAWCRSMPLPQHEAPERPRFLRFHGWSALLLGGLWVLVWIVWRRGGGPS